MANMNAVETVLVIRMACARLERKCSENGSSLELPNDYINARTKKQANQFQSKSSALVGN